jgi:hypothetical protein
MKLNRSNNNNNNLVANRVVECLAMGMIGDGALAFVEPERHAELWQQGPTIWRKMIEPFARRPVLTRWLGAGVAIAGFWLASRQEP